MGTMFFDGSKFREPILKRVTQGTILWNYFKIWHAVSEKNFEEFLWSLHSEKSLPPPPPPPPMAAMFFDRSKCRKQFLKRVTQRTILWNYCKFWLVVSEKKIFSEFLHVRILKKVSPPWRPCFSTDQNFAYNFLKGSPNEHSYEIISKSGKGFQRRRFFKNFFMSVQCKKSPLPLRLCFSADQNFTKNF